MNKPNKKTPVLRLAQPNPPLAEIYGEANTVLENSINQYEHCVVIGQSPDGGVLTAHTPMFPHDLLVLSKMLEQEAMELIYYGDDTDTDTED